MKKILLIGLLSLGLFANEITTPCDFSKQQYNKSKNKMMMAIERQGPLTKFHAQMTLQYMENVIAECDLTKDEQAHYRQGRRILIAYIRELNSKAK